MLPSVVLQVLGHLVILAKMPFQGIPPRQEGLLLAACRSAHLFYVPGSSSGGGSGAAGAGAQQGRRRVRRRRALALAVCCRALSLLSWLQRLCMRWQMPSVLRALCLVSTALALPGSQGIGAGGSLSSTGLALSAGTIFLLSQRWPGAGVCTLLGCVAGEQGLGCH
ncbi:hypothetical protein ABPG75_007655 [Micractinium tetrahymenae]